MQVWCRGVESNYRHKAFQASALPLSYPGVGTTVLILLKKQLLVLQFDLCKFELYWRIATKEVDSQFECSFFFIHFDDSSFTTLK